MELSVESIIALLTVLLGGSGITAIITWRYVRKKAEAEASSAEYEAVQAGMTAMKDMQESYRQMVADVNSDREDQRQYIAELKEDRRHLRAERDELRDRQDKLEQAVRDLRNDMARMGRKVDVMRPLLCGRENCPNRMPVTISAEGTVESPSADRPKRRKAENKIEPYNEG